MALSQKNHSPPSSPAERILSPWSAGLFLLAVTLFLFRDFLSPSGHWVLSQSTEDLAGQFVWWRQFGFDELKKGHLTLWNPHLYGGEPFFGGFQSALLYPPNWFFMFLPLAFALNVSIVLHVFLAGWFAYLWIFYRGSHPVSALTGGFMYMLGAAYFLHIVTGHLPNLCTMAWIPLVFLVIDQYLKTCQPKWLLIGMAVLALQVFSGHIQYVYYTGVISFIYALFNLPGEKEKRLRFLAGLGLIYLGGVLLSAVQLLAGWAATAESVRAQVLDIDYLDIADLSPERLWCLLMPDFFGGYQSYWGGGMYQEGAVFVSVTAFVLALFALKNVRHPQKLFFAGLALALILVAVGKRAPFFALFCKYFPLFDHFRGIGKLNIFITLCLVALAAIGMDEIFRNPLSLKKLASETRLGGYLFLSITLILVIIPQRAWGRHLSPFLIHAGQMTQSLLQCGFTLLLLFLLAHFSLRWAPLRYGFALLALVELFFFASENLPRFDLNELKQQVSQIQAVYDQHPGDYRIFTHATNYALGTTGSSIWGDDPSFSSRYSRFAAQAENLKIYDSHKNEPLADYPKALGLTRLQYAFDLEQGQLKTQKLDLTPVPRAALVDHWEIGTVNSILPQLMNPKFDFKKNVYLESAPLILAVPSRDKGEVFLKNLSTDAVEITAQLPSPKILVLSDNYSRDWKIFPILLSAQNGYQVMPANGFQMAVPLAAGSHHFILEYQPTAFVMGCWISGLSWLLWLGCFFLAVIRNRRRHSILNC